MRKFEYKPPRVHTGDLRTLVRFWEYKPNDGPMPGEGRYEVVFKAWAKIDNVWLKDLELAKSNGTASDITIVMRDPQAEFIPSTKHYIEIKSPEYKGTDYNVKHVQPDLQNKSFINIVAEVRSA